MRVEGYNLLLFLEAFADKGGFEAELPNCEEDVIEKLKAYASAETGFASTSDGAAAVEEGRVAVFGRSDCCTKDVDERIYGLLTLVPEDLPGFLCTEEGGIFLYCYVLQAAVLAFR